MNPPLEGEIRRSNGWSLITANSWLLDDCKLVVLKQDDLLLTLSTVDAGWGGRLILVISPRFGVGLVDYMGTFPMG